MSLLRSKHRSKPFSVPLVYRSPACQSASLVSGTPSSHFCSSTRSARFTFPSALMSPEIAGGSVAVAVVDAVVVSVVAAVVDVVVAAVVVVVVVVVAVVVTVVVSVFACHF